MLINFFFITSFCIAKRFEKLSRFSLEFFNVFFDTTLYLPLIILYITSFYTFDEGLWDYVSSLQFSFSFKFFRHRFVFTSKALFSINVYCLSNHFTSFCVALQHIFPLHVSLRKFRSSRSNDYTNKIQEITLSVMRCKTSKQHLWHAIVEKFTSGMYLVEFSCCWILNSYIWLPSLQ